MDSNKIKSLAFGARDALRREVAAKIDSVLAEGSPERLDQPGKVAPLEKAVAEKGRDAVAESCAYTWFNRLCALRYMDARGYTPVPVVTPREGSTQPAVLGDAVQGVFDPDFGFSRLVRDKVASVLMGGTSAGSNRTEAAYSQLLVAVCEHYAKPMPYLFGEAAASSLVVPSGLLSEGSILRRIVAEMDDMACESVEVLGWLYQFYVAERKDEFFKSKRKAAPEDIAPATQLFTPNWIVRYLVENSLGRLWMLNNPSSPLAQRMDYYLAPEGDTEDFNRIYSPEELTLCDPACGSGHILVYAFDLLFQIYEGEGYFPEDIPSLILQNNLYGFEIDNRAAEIAKFALEMKAREKDPDFFERGIDAQIVVLEPVRFDEEELQQAGVLAGATKLLQVFEHLGEAGSLYAPEPGDSVLIENAISNLERESGMFAEATLAKLRYMQRIIILLSQKFDCVVANPPYMGSGKFNAWMSKWVAEHYPEGKPDLFASFIQRGFSLTKSSGYNAMVTMQSWMFLGSFEKLRVNILDSKAIVSMAHLGARAFDQIGGEVVQTTAAVLANGNTDVQGSYVRLVNQNGELTKSQALKEAICNPDCGWFYRADQQNFKKIPGSPIAYWASNSELEAFASGRPLNTLAEPKQGLSSGNNSHFLRLWWEPILGRVKLDSKDSQDAANSGAKWFPCNKGGSFRRWYGNNEYLLNWEDNGAEIRRFKGSAIRNPSYYFKEGITWSSVSSDLISMRYSKPSNMFVGGGSTCFAEPQELLYLCALANCSVVICLLEIINPTLNFSEGPVGAIPVILDDNQIDRVNSITKKCIDISSCDWDSYETSWDFIEQPLVRHHKSGEPLAFAYESWKAECDERFYQLKANEEGLNRIFAQIYHMEDEVPIEVPLDKVSVHIVFDSEAEVPAEFKNSNYVRTKADEVKSLISYGVGCIMGRYSTYAPGLILADAGQTLADFKQKVPQAAFLPDEDAIIPVLDDEWFVDDIVFQFKKWLADTFGADELEESVDFVEEALGKDIRAYFVKDFYKDHCATYSVASSGKRPIYWMFSSPKGSFKALVYMHRYTPSTVGQMLTKYLREYIEKLTASIGVLEMSDRAADARKADKYRSTVKELTDWERDVVYPLANERVEIDLDDGVKVNYNKFPHALAKVPGLSEWK